MENFADNKMLLAFKNILIIIGPFETADIYRMSWFLIKSFVLGRKSTNGGRNNLLRQIQEIEIRNMVRIQLSLYFQFFEGNV